MDWQTFDELLNSGMAAHRGRDFARAEALYREVLRHRPDHARATHMLGVLAHQAGHPEPAIELLRRAATLDPTNPDFHYNLGWVLEQIGREDEAIEAYRAALKRMPAHRVARDRLGGLLLRKMPPPVEEIEAHARASITLEATNADAHYMLGAAAAISGNMKAAMASLERAIALRPDFALARWHRSLLLLAEGDFEQGWREYEWRLRLESGRRPTFSQPRWEGGPLAGKTLLVSAEQGFGDVIQFLRYIPMLAERGGRVIVGCAPELERLVRGVNGVQEVVSSAAALPPFDLHVSLMSLPFLFRTTADAIPAAIPYVSAAPELAQRWNEKLGKRDGKPRVGICLAGERGTDCTRECPPELLAPLASDGAVVLYNLQKARREGLPALPSIDFTEELTNFAETAALIQQLDQVISIDTAVAHLSGAMGKRTCVLLPLNADWRWRGRDDCCAWYPTMQLFRQRRGGDWEEVCKRLIHQVRSSQFH